MTTIGDTGELAAYLRAQLTALRRPATVDRAGQAAANARPAIIDRRAESPSAARAREDLASALARRIGAINPEDPGRKRRAFRVFLESLVLDEWGPQLINDPAFHQMLDSIHAQMESRPDLLPLMERAADVLLAGPSGVMQKPSR